MFSPSNKKLFALVSFLFVSLFLSGCGVWRNFTTYFNTYYNAKTLFDQTEETILKQKKDIFLFRSDQQKNQQQGQYGASQYGQQQYNQNQYNQYNQNQGGYQNQYGGQQYGGNQFGGQSQFGQQGNPSGNLASGNVNQDLTKVIEKCSKILQYENKSGYFPDALFIAGKALYYQEEYSKAQRKFTELAGLGETKYTLINKLWLAKTNLQLFNIDEGLKLTEEVKEEALQKKEKEIYGEAVITRISFFMYREEFTRAVNECRSFLDNSDNEELKGLIAFQLAKINQRTGDKQNALTSFKKVLEYDPTPEVEFKSRIEHAKLLRQLDKIDESRDELENLRDAGKFKNNLDEIYLELGDIYVAQNEIKKAVDLFKIVDTTYKMLPTSGTASFKLAEVYKNKVRDLDSAQKYYAKLAISPVSLELKKSADITAKNLTRYFTYKEEYENLVKQIGYINQPSNYTRDSIDYAIAYKDVMDEGKILVEKQNAQNASSNFSQRIVQSQITDDQILQQQKQVLQMEKQKERIKNPNQYQVRPPSLKELIILGKVKKPERLKMSADSAKQVIAQNLFNQGSIFFSELDFPDSAFICFNTILKNYKGKVIPQTLYSLGTYYETRNDTLKADSLFKVIYDNYPKNPIWEPAGRKLGLIKTEAKKSVVKVEDDGEKPYLAAEDLYFKKDYKAAVDTFYSIYKRFPKSYYAAKSVFFAGMIYEENLKNNDSAATAYSILSKEFSNEPVSKPAIEKYLAYTSEKQRIKQEEEAKLKAEEQKKKEEEEKLKAQQAASAVEKKGDAEIKKPETIITPADSAKKVPAVIDSSKIKAKALPEI